MLTDPELSPERRAAELDRATQAAEQRKRESDELEREAPGLVAHGDSILQKIKDAQAPYKRLTGDDLRDYISAVLTHNYPGTRIEPIPSLDIEAYDIRLSPKAQADFERYRSQNIRRYPTRFSRDAGSGVKVIFGSNPDPLRYRAFEAVPMTHPLARFCARIRDERQAGMAPRPATAFLMKKPLGLNLKPGTYAVAVQRWSIDGLLPVDRLSFRGVNLSDQHILAEEDAERLLMEALAKEPQLLNLKSKELETAHDAVSKILMPALDAMWEDYQQATAADHYDRVETQRALIVEHKERRRREAESRIRDLRYAGGEGRMRIVVLEEGKLKKFLARMDVKLDEIADRERRLTFEEPILAGVALIVVEER